MHVCIPYKHLTVYSLNYRNLDKKKKYTFLTPLPYRDLARFAMT